MIVHLNSGQRGFSWAQCLSGFYYCFLCKYMQGFRQPLLSIPMVNCNFGFKCCTKYRKACFPCGHTATNTGFCKETEALALATSLSVHDETWFYPKYHNIWIKYHYTIQQCSCQKFNKNGIFPLPYTNRNVVNVYGTKILKTMQLIQLLTFFFSFRNYLQRLSLNINKFISRITVYT